MTPIAIRLPAAISAAAGRGGPNFAMLSPTPTLTAIIPCMIKIVETSGLVNNPPDRRGGLVGWGDLESGMGGSQNGGVVRV